MKNIILLLATAALLAGSAVQSANIGFSADGNFLEIWHSLIEPSQEKKITHLGFNDRLLAHPDPTLAMNADFILKRQTMEALLDTIPMYAGYHLSNAIPQARNQNKTSSDLNDLKDAPLSLRLDWKLNSK